MSIDDDFIDLTDDAELIEGDIDDERWMDRLLEELGEESSDALGPIAESFVTARTASFD